MMKTSEYVSVDGLSLEPSSPNGVGDENSAVVSRQGFSSRNV